MNKISPFWKKKKETNGGSLENKLSSDIQVESFALY